MLVKAVLYNCDDLDGLRWLRKLEQHNFKIVRFKGGLIIYADALSRQPVMSPLGGIEVLVERIAKILCDCLFKPTVFCVPDQSARNPISVDGNELCFYERCVDQDEIRDFYEMGDLVMLKIQMHPNLDLLYSGAHEILDASPPNYTMDYEENPIYCGQELKIFMSQSEI